MNRFGRALIFLLLGTVLVASLGCGERAVAQKISSLNNLASENGLPLRASWVQVLTKQGQEDLFRPMRYASPLVVDGVVYLGDNDNSFYAFKAENGDRLWRFATYGAVECQAVVVGDAVIFGDGDGYVYAVNRKNGLLKWTYHVQGQVMGRLVSDGKLVFVRTTHERVYAITLADGKWKWMQSREMPTSFTIRGVASPVLDGNRLLIGYADGYLLAYNAADGTEAFKTMLEKGDRFVDIDTTPVIDGKNMYVASYSGTLYCLSRENAAIQWTFRKGSVQRVSMGRGANADQLFLGDDEGFVHSLDKNTGKLQWSYDIRETDELRSLVKGPRRALKVPTNPIPYHGSVIVASSSGYLYSLDQTTGALQWNYWPGYGVTSEIVVEKDAFYVFTNFGNLYCLKPNYYFHPTPES